MLEKIQQQEEIIQQISQMISVCKKHIENNNLEREKAIDYYNYKLTDFMPEQGRSTSVSNELRTVVKDILPSLVRSFFKVNNLVNYEANKPEDEEMSEQASLYINRIILKECNFEIAIYDAIFDAILLKTGILKWQAREKYNVEFYKYEQQTQEAIDLLAMDGDIEVTDLNKNADNTFDFALKRTKKETKIEVKAIPRGSFLIYPNVDLINDSPIVGDMELVTRSELVSRGYDKEKVYNLNISDGINNDDDSDDFKRKKDNNYNYAETLSEENENILIYNLFLKLDLDKDGVSEIYSACVAEGGESQHGQYEILSFEQNYEYPYSSVVIEREAHQFEGRSIAEDVMSLQKVNTSLMRQALDNIYWSNNPQKVINKGAISPENLESIMNPDFGQPLLVKNRDEMDSIKFIQTPFIATQAFEAIDIIRTQIQGRTGINDAAGSLNPNNLSNVTQIAIESLNAPALAQSEMMLRNISNGLENVFNGLLKLVIQYAEQPKIRKIDNEWKEFDPRLWDFDMRCIISLGFGTGGRKEDMQLLTTILGYQKEIIQSLGTDNDFVKPENLFNTLENLLLSAGISSVGSYFNKPDRQAMQQKAMQAQQVPNPEMLKLQQQKELEMLKMQTQSQIEEKQMQSDLSVQQAELEKKYALETQKLEFERQKLELKKYEIELKYRKDNNEYI